LIDDGDFHARPREAADGVVNVGANDGAVRKIFFPNRQRGTIENPDFQDFDLFARIGAKYLSYKAR